MHSLTPNYSYDLIKVNSSIRGQLDLIPGGGGGGGGGGGDQPHTLELIKAFLVDIATSKQADFS